MKKFLATFAALLFLTACGAEKTPAEEPVVPETPAVEAPVTELPAVTPGGSDELSFATERLEGLVEDTVAYIYDYPRFDHAEIDGYYDELMTSLTEYAKGTVYTNAIERRTIADVTGTFAVEQTAETVTVTYTVAVDFADGQSESFDRADTFDSVTGALMAE